MQSQTIPKETFIIVIFGGMIRRYDSGYGSGYDSWVWFAELELPTLTKICTPEKKTQPYIHIVIQECLLLDITEMRLCSEHSIFYLLQDD